MSSKEDDELERAQLALELQQRLADVAKVAAIEYANGTSNLTAALGLMICAYANDTSKLTAAIGLMICARFERLIAALESVSDNVHECDRSLTLIANEMPNAAIYVLNPGDGCDVQTFDATADAVAEFYAARETERGKHAALFKLDGGVWSKWSGRRFDRLAEDALSHTAGFCVKVANVRDRGAR